MEYLYFLGRITICFILGSMIGIERQYRRKIAGVRTITLVAIGAFLFVSISRLTTGHDVTRIAAQVVSGIGFLGAGVILRDGTNVKGLNTAATLWCSAAVGTLIALDFIIEAFIGVFYIIFSNVFLRFISKKMSKINSNGNIFHYNLVVNCVSDKEVIVKNVLIQKLNSHKSVIKNFYTDSNGTSVKIKLLIEVSEDSSFMDTVVNKLCIEPGVSLVEYTKINNYTEDDDDDDVK